MSACTPIFESAADILRTTVSAPPVMGQKVGEIISTRIRDSSSKLSFVTKQQNHALHRVQIGVINVAAVGFSLHGGGQTAILRTGRPCMFFENYCLERFHYVTRKALDQTFGYCHSYGMCV